MVARLPSTTKLEAKVPESPPASAYVAQAPEVQAFPEQTPAIQSPDVRPAIPAGSQYLDVPSPVVAIAPPVSRFRSPSDVYTPGWRASADFLNWTLHRRGLDYAIPTDDTAGSVGVGEVQSVLYDAAAGFRTALGYGRSNGMQLLFRYTSFETDAQASVVSSGGSLWATRAHPNQGEEALTADAFSSIDYDVFDFEIKKWMALGKTSGLAVLGGFRWAGISQNFGVDYDGSDFSAAEYRNPVDMNAFGLRMGVEAQAQIRRRLRGFGTMAGSVLKGDFSTRIHETNFSGSNVIVDVTDEYSTAVMQFEVAAGLQWHYGPFDVSVGYELTNWTDLGERSFLPKRDTRRRI